MKPVAFLFPGVGSHYIGMSKTLYDNFEVYRKTLEEASDLLKVDMNGMFFMKEKKEELDKIDNAQTVMLTASIASYRVFQQEIGLQPQYCMGHSLGEYSALCSAGVVTFPDALKLVKERGLIIHDVASRINGTMMWVINLDVQAIEDICKETSSPGHEIYISAYDSPTQASISGHTDTLMSTAKILEGKGAIVYPLKFSGPFHSPLMKEASERMAGVLNQYTFKDPVCEVIANHNALPYKDVKDVSGHLSTQLVCPIYWRSSLLYLAEKSVEKAIEMGPKNVLKFLVQKNTDAIKVFTTDNSKDIETIKEEMVLKTEDYLGAIGRCLGAAVSTKNNMTDQSPNAYEEKVIRPYRKIEAMYNEFVSNGKTPGKEQVKEALEMAYHIMAVKNTPAKQQEKLIEKILKNKYL